MRRIHTCQVVDFNRRCAEWLPCSAEECKEAYVLCATGRAQVTGEPAGLFYLNHSFERAGLRVVAGASQLFVSGIPLEYGELVQDSGQIHTGKQSGRSYFRLNLGYFCAGRGMSQRFTQRATL